MADNLGADDIFELKSALQMLVAEMRDAANGTKDFTRAVGQQLAIEENDRKEAAKRAQAQKAADKAMKDLTSSIKDFSVKQEAFNKMFGEKSSVMMAAFDGLVTRLKAVGKALMDGVQIAMDGVKNARDIGIAAQEGVTLEIGTMVESLKSIRSFDPNQIFNQEEIKSTSKAAAAAFGGFSAGLEPSAEGLRQFNQNLGKAGIFGPPTAETFKALALTGTTTVAGFESLRAATGRQSIQTGTLTNIINKNLTSINIFGTSMLKRALDFDRLGISLDALNKGAESYVTNLDGQIDALAQLGQLGTEIDFEKLTMLQEFGAPGEAQRYVASLINAEDLRSSSYRALLGQIAGINVDEILKIKGAGNFERLEKQVTKNADATGETNEKLTLFAQIIDTIANNKLVKFAGSLILAVGSLAAFILQLVVSMRTLRVLSGGGPGGTPPGGGPPVPPPGGPPPTRGIGAKILGGAKVGAGVGIASGLISGVMEYQQSKSLSKAFGRALANFIGAAIGGGLATLIPIPGMTFVGAAAGSWAGNWIFDNFFNKADDMVSAPSGYGDRTLLTPKGSLSLNNNDTIIAGTNLNNKQPESGKSQEVSQLVAKIDSLMEMLRNAQTVIDVAGSPRQRVPRFQLVGVYSRNEME